jgi:hypothetical protein
MSEPSKSRRVQRSPFPSLLQPATAALLNSREIEDETDAEFETIVVATPALSPLTSPLRLFPKELKHSRNSSTQVLKNAAMWTQPERVGSS